MARYLFRNAQILDAERGDYLADNSVLVEGDRILEVGGAEVQASNAQSFDLAGLTLLPGLIDAHVHVTAVTADLAALAEWSAAYVTARAARVLAGMLRRGFTTVRDVGGADYGLAQAIEEGYLEGPRLLFGGKALSQTGGHGNLMDDSSLPLFQERGAFYVPTLATYSALAARGREFGLPEHSHRKVFEVLDAGLHALELAHRANIPIVYGTDLLGGMHEEQLSEFTLRRQVQPPADIVRSATTVAARLLRLEGQVGVVAPGASADLLVVEGDPLQEIAVLTDPQRRLKLVMTRGRMAVNHLA